MNGRRKNGVDIFDNESAVLEYSEHEKIENDRSSSCGSILARALILSDNEPREIVYNGAQKHQKDVDGFTPCVEYQRKDDQHRVFVFDTAGSRISDKA